MSMGSSQGVPVSATSITSGPKWRDWQVSSLTWIIYSHSLRQDTEGDMHKDVWSQRVQICSLWDYFWTWQLHLQLKHAPVCQHVHCHYHFYTPYPKVAAFLLSECNVLFKYLGTGALHYVEWKPFSPAAESKRSNEPTPYICLSVSPDLPLAPG